MTKINGRQEVNIFSPPTPQHFIPNMHRVMRCYASLYDIAVEASVIVAVLVCRTTPPASCAIHSGPRIPSMRYPGRIQDNPATERAISHKCTHDAVDS